MSVALARIDDRMIHGQVTVGWGQQLQPDTILLANNVIAADPWQQRVYAASVPPDIAVAILPVAEAAARLTEAEAVGERVLLLTGSPGEMAELVREQDSEQADREWNAHLEVPKNSRYQTQRVAGEMSAVSEQGSGKDHAEKGCYEQKQVDQWVGGAWFDDALHEQDGIQTVFLAE